VPEAKERGADAKLHLVEENQDIEEPQASVADEGKHQSINLRLHLDVNIGALGIELTLMLNRSSIGIMLQYQYHRLDVAESTT
jgi:hypothetical protein